MMTVYEVPYDTNSLPITVWLFILSFWLHFKTSSRRANHVQKQLQNHELKPFQNLRCLRVAFSAIAQESREPLAQSALDLVWQDHSLRSAVSSPIA